MMRRDRKAIENTYYSTKQLAKLLRVDQTTVRRWADSGKLNCFRSPGGHRKFTPERVEEFITKYQYEVLPLRSGSSFEAGKKSLLSLISPRDLHTLSEVFFAEAVRGETDKLRAMLLDCYHADIPLADIYDIIIRKTIRKILNLQKDGRLSETDKHICQSSMVESLNQFQSSSQNAITNGRIAICGSPVNALEETLLLGVDHLLRAAGWKVYDLGSNTPVDVLFKAIEEYKPILICVSAAYFAKEEDQQNCVVLEKAAGLSGAELLFCDLFSEEIKSPRLPPTEAKRNIISSLKDLVPYATKPFPEIDAQRRHVTRSTSSNAVESMDAPNE
jgi:excisionase family DNA binding protein